MFTSIEISRQHWYFILIFKYVCTRQETIKMAMWARIRYLVGNSRKNINSPLGLLLMWGGCLEITTYNKIGFLVCVCKCLRQVTTWVTIKRWIIFFLCVLGSFRYLWKNVYVKIGLLLMWAGCLEITITNYIFYVCMDVFTPSDHIRGNLRRIMLLSYI